LSFEYKKKYRRRRKEEKKITKNEKMN